MRVLFSSTSGFGHVIPMLQLAAAFRDAGHEVLFATAAQATPMVTEAGIDAVAAGAHGAEEKALRAEVLGPAENLPGTERPPFVFPRMFGSALTPRMVEDLLPLARDGGEITLTGLEKGLQIRLHPDDGPIYLVGNVDVLPAGSCAGDCHGDGLVTVDELTTSVGIALESVPPIQCAAADTNDDGDVSVDEIIAAVQGALGACS